jgi:hypothetical protein
VNERPALGLIVVTAAGFLGIVFDINSVFGTAAESFLTIERSSIVTTDDDDGGELTAELDVEGVQIPTNGTHGAFGYGMITDDGDETILVAHTHAGLLDSEAQRFIEDPNWHNHFVKFGDVEHCGEDQGIVGITWQSPGEVGIDDNIVRISDVPTGQIEGQHSSMTGESLSFTLGEAVSDVISFKLNSVFGDDGLEAVCVTDIRSAEEVVNLD